MDVDKATVMACGSGELLQLGIDVDTVESPRPRPVSNLSDCRVRWVSNSKFTQYCLWFNNTTRLLQEEDPMLLLLLTLRARERFIHGDVTISLH